MGDPPTAIPQQRRVALAALSQVNTAPAPSAPSLLNKGVDSPRILYKQTRLQLSPKHLPTFMRPEIHWLLHFCLENQLLTEGQVLGMVANLAPSTDVHACAKLLANSGWIADTAFLDSAIEASIKNTQDGFELPVLHVAGAFFSGKRPSQIC